MVLLKVQSGISERIMTFESTTFVQILAYMFENRIKVTLEAESKQKKDIKVIIVKVNKIEEFCKDKVPDNQRLVCT